MKILQIAVLSALSLSCLAMQVEPRYENVVRRTYVITAMRLDDGAVIRVTFNPLTNTYAGIESEAVDTGIGLLPGSPFYRHLSEEEARGIFRQLAGTEKG